MKLGKKKKFSLRLKPPAARQGGKGRRKGDRLLDPHKGREHNRKKKKEYTRGTSNAVRQGWGGGPQKGIAKSPKGRFTNNIPGRTCWHGAGLRAS